MSNQHSRDHHDHHHEESHGHSHSHHHSVPTNHGNAFIISIILNTGFVAVELAYGFIANSTALIADAGHNLSDVLSLLLAWGASALSRKTPNGRFTYGLRSTSILASLINATILLVVCGAIAWEAVQRIATPPTVTGLTVALVAGVGIVINGASALLFMKGSEHDLNIRGAYLHMASDALVSLGVVLAGVAIIYTGWYWLDPIVSLAIVVVIVVGTWGLLRESSNLALNAVPSNIDMIAVETYLRQCQGVADIHDLHIWGMSTTESALTVHLVIPEGYLGDGYMDEITQTLKSRFAIVHSTIQIEQGTTNHACSLHS